MTDLLFFTPVLPFPTGNGPAMRASVAVELLAERYRVFVVHPELWGWRQGIFQEDWVRNVATGYFRLPGQIEATTARDLVTDCLSGVRPAAAYVFRLSAAPFALQVMGQMGATAPSVLDLDDDEYGRGVRFADLHESLGDSALAERERRELPKLQTFQRMFLPRFSASLLANSADRDRFAAQYPKLRFEHLPNVVRLPERASHAIVNAESMLFLGTLDYLPNEDAARHFCTAILPLIRSENPHAVVRLTGTGATRSVLELGNLPGVTVVGTVNDLAAEYQRCGIFVVPLRAGAGSRIKILEAFSYRRPVVSTSAGADGLNVVHQEHLLIADSPAEFASACLRLERDPDLCSRLTGNAHRWLVETHSVSRARGVLRSLFPEARP